MTKTITYALGAVLLALFSGFAHAADQALTKAQLEALIVGKTATFSDGGRASYKNNGNYQFRAGKNVYNGKYSVGDGMVCVLFSNNDTRCDRYVKTGNGYVLINQRGGRFPVTIK
jgi:hypothetical protein